MAGLLFSLFPTALLFITTSTSVVSGQSTGVYLSLRGANIPSDGYVLASDIGFDNTSLHCNTDRSDCCTYGDNPSGVAQGHWYRPDGTQVGSYTQEYTWPRIFFYRNRATGIVHLNRAGNPPHRGRFRCEVPNASGTLVNLYVNIVDVMVSITPSGNNTAGESYSPECAVNVTGAIDQPRITWLMGPMNSTVTTGVVTTGNVSTLTFDPLAASDAGTYTCRATLGSVIETEEMNVTVQTPVTSAHISTSGPPTLGQTGYSLTCGVTGADNLSPSITYKWNKINSQVQAGTDRVLSLSPLRLSDAGQYTCQATVSSSYLNDDITMIASLDIILQIPAPTSVRVTPRPVIPIIVGSSINLICTVHVELNPLVDVPVNVTIDWSGPDGFTIANTVQPVIGSPATTYTSTAMVSSSGREQTGNYTCKATVRSMTPTHSLIESVGYSSSRVIVVPEPIMSVHSDSPDNVFYGHSPTLICTVEMSSVVDVPLSMMIVWKGPNGTAVTSPNRPEMKSFTLYTLSSSLTSVDSADSGEYTCTVRFENGVEISTNINITIVDGVFQLRLKSVGICQQWYSESCGRPEQYSSFIKEALIKAIKHHCKCHFPITNLLNDDLFAICKDSPNLMVYRNAVMGTLNFNGTEIVDFIQDWVSTGPLIKINGNPVRVDSSYPTAISSLDEPVCGEKEEECLCDNDPKYAMCAQHLDDNNVATCFEGCIVRNG